MRRGEICFFAAVRHAVQPGKSRVSMQVEVAGLFAEREIDLQPGAIGVVFGTPGRQNDAQTWRERWAPGRFFEGLIAIVDQYAANVRGRCKWNRVRELMRDGRRRPLLCEAAFPFTVAVTR